MTRALWLVAGDAQAIAAHLRPHVDVIPLDCAPADVKGRDVVIWRPADLAGRRLAAEVAKRVTANGSAPERLRIVLAQEGWDISASIVRDPELWGYDSLAGFADQFAETFTHVADVPRETRSTVVLEKKPDPPPEPPIQIPPERNTTDPMTSGMLILGTDLQAARSFSERHGENLRYAMEASWLVWEGTRWQVDEKGVMVAALAKESAEAMFDSLRDAPDEARKEIFKAAKAGLQKRAIEAVIWLARSEKGIPAHLTTFDANPWIINCQNGIVDLKTGQLSPHKREAKCTLIAGTSFEPSFPCPRWLQFIGEICLENNELIDYLQRMCGYLLTANISEQCLFFLHGGGSNGKTTFVETVMRVMGGYATAGEPDLLMTRKNQGIPADVAKLRGARAVFLNETNQGHRFDEAKLKNLTGGDTLEARFMRENFFTFRPTHKLVLRGNHKPTVTGTDEGIWRRLRLIPFDLRLSDSERDRTLEDTLAGELPGILAWMVAGCLMWQKDGIKTPQVITEALKEYRDESDTMGRFIQERCTIKANTQIKSSVLYKAYRTFCEEGHERYLSAKDFPSELEHRDPCIKRDRTKAGAIFTGIEIAADTEWAADMRGDRY